MWDKKKYECLLEHTPLIKFIRNPSWTRACTEIRIWDSFWTRKWLCLEAFHLLNFFHRSFFFPFLIFLGDFQVSLLPVQASRPSIQTGNFYLGVATSRRSRTEFSCKFFTQIPEHLYAYLRLHWVDHSDH